MKYKFFLLITTGILAFVSCKKDTKDTKEAISPTSSGSTATLSFTINGTSFTSTSFNNTITNASQMGQTGKRLDIRGSFGSGNILILSVSNWEWQNPPVNGVLVKKYDTDIYGANSSCQDISGYTFCDGALGTYLIGGTNTHMTINDTIPGYIQISSCDATNKKVSGSFYFLTSDAEMTTYDTIQGTFTNQVYTVQ